MAIIRLKSRNPVCPSDTVESRRSNGICCTSALCKQSRSRKDRARGKRFRADVLAVGSRIGHPAIDGGLAPAAAMLADLDLPRKRPFAHFAVDCGPAEPRAIKHRSHAKDFLRLGHSSHPIRPQQIDLRAPMRSQRRLFRRASVVVECWRTFTHGDERKRTRTR